MTFELSLSSIPNPAYMEVDDKAIWFLPHYESQPLISIVEFGKIVDCLHANDNYMFSQEYDVRGWRFNYCYFIGYRKYAPQPSVDVCLINPKKQ